MVKGSLDKGRKCLAVFLDFKGAFQKTWNTGILHKMIFRAGVPIEVVQWFQSFLAGRKACVNWCGYADDCVILCDGNTVEECVIKMNERLRKIAEWIDKLRLPVSMDKTEFNVPPRIVFKGQQLLYSAEPKYLGVTFDECLTFKGHVSIVADRMASRCKVLRALTGTSWGCRPATLRRTYWGYVRAVAEYAAAAWRPFISRESAFKLEVQQGDAASVITGCHRNTRTQALLAEAGLMPLGERAKELMAKAKQRYERLPPGCPAHRWVEYLRESGAVADLEEEAGLK
eukprot:gene17949-biopygen27386